MIGDNNLLTANNIGTGLQGVVAGDRNFLAGNQVIVPTSFGTNFGWMGDDNGDFDLNLPDSPGDQLNLNPFEILALEPSGNNIVASPFSYGNNTFIMGDGNDGTANNIMLGCGQLRQQHALDRGQVRLRRKQRRRRPRQPRQQHVDHW